MSKKLSIKARITLWYAMLIVFICAASVFTLFALSDYAQTAHCRQTLESAAEIILDELDIETGDLEIDSDIDDVPNVYASLFEADGELIYGRWREDEPFEDGVFRRVRTEGDGWYILDTLIRFEKREDAWLRTYMSANLSLELYGMMLRYGLWLLPLLAACALLGGYLITRRALSPVVRMTQTAASVMHGGDLSGRIPTDGREAGQDELHLLGDTLNGMLSRLESAFEHERQFTSDAAHELRTPINAMRTQGEYALSRMSAEEKDEAIVRMLEKNEEMRQLVEQLLLIARLDAGQAAMDDKVDLAQLIRGIAEDLEPVAAEKGIRLETALCGAQMRGSRALITRAVVNLIDNAIRYGREGGCVKISMERDDGCVLIRVEDDGVGISPDELERVFERFWRGDSARATPGTGIGLAIVKAAVQAHGGEVWAQSEAGKGSCFSIKLFFK